MRSVKILLFLTYSIAIATAYAQSGELFDLGLQYRENPPMLVKTQTPPPIPKITEEFEIKPGYHLIETLDEFRLAIKKDRQKIRLKPGIYRPIKADPPLNFPLKENGKTISSSYQEHIFSVDGSHNTIDLRGVVIETPVSLQNKLSKKVHVADNWHINGNNNTFIGGYFRNVIDLPYPKYHASGNEFEICGNQNRFFDCTFVIKGSSPYGYSDFYGKGKGNYGRLNKHSFMSINQANGTEIIRCKVFQQSFGHCIHFHNVDGALIKDCLLTGTLRPTDDIYKEIVGRAVDNDFHMLYRKRQPIPRGEAIPLTEDGIRSYDNVRNIKIINTTVERMRGAIQLLCTGDVTLENVTVRECGDFSFDVSAIKGNKIIMKNCSGDIAYNPLFNLTRGEVPFKATYEVTILSPPEGTSHTARSSLGKICGDNCRFILRDGLTTPLPEEVNYLICGGDQVLIDSTLENHTSAKLILQENVKNCTIHSLGPVEDHGENNTIIKK